MARNGSSMIVLAWRNLWRNRRRTAITLVSIVFGVFLAVLTAAMQDRNWADMIDLAARMGAGHVTVRHSEALDAPSLALTVEQVTALRRQVLADAEVENATPRISGETMLATAAESQGAGFIAYDPSLEDAGTLAILDALAEGEAFESASDGGILLGRDLAERLDVELGDRVVYTLSDKSGEITSGLARLSGIVATGSPGVDAGFCLLPIDAVREVLGYDADEASQLAVFLGDHRRSAAVAERLGRDLPMAASASTWKEMQPGLASFVAAKVGGGIASSILIAVLVAAGIFNTLFVSVMERLREFGIMRAIGWAPGKLFQLVMLESAWLAMVGLAASAMVTFLPYRYLSIHGIDISAMVGMEDGVDISGIAMPTALKVGIYPQSLALIVLAALLAVLASGLYPAWRAGRVDPAETLRIV